MGQWICEDVGKFANRLRERLSRLLNEYTEMEGETMEPHIEGIIKGLNLAYDELDDEADGWTTTAPMETEEK